MTFFVMFFMKIFMTFLKCIESRPRLSTWERREVFGKIIKRSMVHVKLWRCHWQLEHVRCSSVSTVWICEKKDGVRNTEWKTSWWSKIWTESAGHDGTMGIKADHPHISQQPQPTTQWGGVFGVWCQRCRIILERPRFLSQGTFLEVCICIAFKNKHKIDTFLPWQIQWGLLTAEQFKNCQETTPV